MQAKLLPLPYRYDALEPTIGRKTVLEHHNKHQGKYVEGWNQAEERLAKRQDNASPGMLKGTYESMAFNGAGVILHELYWENLCPAGTAEKPSPAFVQCVNQCFGSMQNLVNSMANVGSVIRGSGWIVLCWIPRFQRMVLLPIRNHEDGWIPGAVPLLIIDVWEHAYYLDYQSARMRYLQLIWQNVNWGVVSKRWEDAQKR